MSFAARLIHKLAVVTPTPGPADESGHSTEGTPVVEEVNGLVQPRRATEVALLSQAGAPLSDHIVFLAPRALSQSAYIRFNPDDGRRYEIVGIRSFEFGKSPHLEVDSRLVGSPTAAEEGS